MTLSTIAILLWLLAALVAWLATRPSDAQRTALGHVSAGSEGALKLFGRRWRRDLTAGDLATLSSLRWRQIGSLVLLALGLVTIAWLRAAEIQRSEPLIVERPSTPLSEPEPPPPGITGTLGPSVTVVGKEPAPPDLPPEERKPKTVFAGDEEAVEPRRTYTRLFGDARVGAVYDNEQLLGIRIGNVVEGSFWEDLGIEEGDVVLELNHRLMDEPEASTYLMNALAREPVLIMRVRDAEGVERFLEYRTPE